MRACPLPLRDASKAKDLYVGSVEKLQRDADRKRVRNPDFYPPVPTPTSLDYDEGIPLLPILLASVAVEIPATRSDFAGRNSPWGVAIRQEPRPRTAGTAKPLNESQRTEDRNHPAFLNLDQRRQGAPFSLNKNYNPGPPVRSRGSVLQVPTCSVTSCMTSLSGEK
jgi:hypothetical protein